MTLTTDLSGPCSWDIRTTRTELAAGRISHVEHLDALLERLPTAQRLGAVISADPELARALAHALDRRETRGPLTGIPLAVKDIVDVAGFPTTGGTRSLERDVVARDAPAVARLREAGALFALKTNLHELSFGITSNNGAYGPVRHPADPALSPGGSSGGSAVAVAVGLVPAAVAADTGGSARIPAALCGIVGFRPTLGRYPSSGVLPIAHSRDTIGPMARTVDDIVLLRASTRWAHPARGTWSSTTRAPARSTASGSACPSCSSRTWSRAWTRSSARACGHSRRRARSSCRWTCAPPASWPPRPA